MYKRQAGFNFSTVYKKTLNFTETENRNYGITEQMNSYLDQNSKETVFIGSMLNFTYKLNDANKIGVKKSCHPVEKRKSLRITLCEGCYS